MMPFQPLPKSKKQIVIAIVATLLFVIHLLLELLIKDDGQKTLAFDVFVPIVNFISTIALFYAAWQVRLSSPGCSRAWGLIALAQLFNTIGDSLWLIYEGILGQSPFPSPADIFYLAFYPLFMAGIFTLPSRKQSILNWIKISFDTCIISLFAFLLFYSFIIGPILKTTTEKTLFEQILTIAYPIGDILLFWALLVLFYRHMPDRQSSVPLRLLTIGIFAQIVTDCIWSYTTTLETYSGGSFINIGYTVSYLLLGASGILYEYELPDTQPVPKMKQRANYQSFSWRAVLPYLWIFSAYLFLIIYLFKPLPIHPMILSWSIAAIFVLVVLRQMITLRENNVLYQDLEKALQQVQHKTQQLITINSDLQIEINERKKIEEQLIHDALYDDLTGLPNRALFLDRLSHAITKKQHFPNFSYAVLFLDLDSFKVINDSLGHTIGDELLKAVSQVLLHSIPSTDMVARLGGDEFVILLEDFQQPEDVWEIANCIKQNMHEPIVLKDMNIVISASIGIVMETNAYDFPDDVLRDADLAMYQAKISGKACYKVFRTGMRIGAITRLTMESDLRQALEKQEFQLYYQPVLSLPEQHLVGFEALIRWNHPEHGLLLPSSFIGLSEETGLIVPLGRWAIFEACRQLKEWQINFPFAEKIKMSVNISGKQLKQPDFINMVHTALQSAHLPGKSLILEITESVCIDEPEKTAKLIYQLNELGVETQIDDFGTGYSSLSYLQHFVVGSIKIDRSFIQRINDGSEKSPDVISGIMSLVRSLGINAIAEGIENEAQLNELNRLGCLFGQGFLLATPMGKGEIERWMSEYIAKEKAESNKPPLLQSNL